MINANSLEEREWWVSSGLWYPPISTRVLITDLDLLYQETGLVRVRTESERVAIWWDVDNVDTSSLRSVVNYLDQMQSEMKEFSLNFFKVGWVEERYDSPMAAMDRIGQVELFRGVDLLPETRIHRLPLSEISFSSALLRRAFAAVRGRDWFARLLGGPLAQYGLFFGRHSPIDALAFSFVGANSECARMLGNAWQRQAIGKPADGAFADGNFDRRISSSYASSLANREPLLEHIVGLIDVGPHRIWLPYQRLLLPDGDRLACFTAITQDLACPFLSH